MDKNKLEILKFELSKHDAICASAINRTSLDSCSKDALIEMMKKSNEITQKLIALIEEG